MIHEDGDILNFLCTSNGIDVNCLANERSRVVKLEAFFSGFPKIIPLSGFPNLNQLIIINQPIKVIENLDSCINLTSLWICECEIVDIEGLEQCGQIRNLYLYDNKITKIKNLDSLRLLECLWLNNNYISVIEGLNELMILDELNLAGNMIKSIGHSLKANISIEKLNLSGNIIDNLDDILNLCSLPKLKHLNINGPDFMPNPIFNFTNYFLFILFHFSNLKSLDSFDVNCSYLRDVVLNIVSKKKLFYFMKKETLSRSCEFIKLRLKSVNKEILIDYEVRLKTFYNLLHLMEQRQFINSEKWLNLTEENETVINDFEENIIELRTKCREIEAICDQLGNEAEFYMKKADIQHSELIDLHQMELSSCGNFKFELSCEKIWANLCNDLLNSRFCNYEVQNYNLTKIICQRVLKIKNIQVDKNYEKKINEIINKNEVFENCELKEGKNQDYLFYLSDNNDERNLVELLKSFYNKNNSKNGFKLTNSLFLGDLYRSKSSDSLEGVYYGRVIIVKTFTGVTAESGKMKNNSSIDNYRMSLKNCTSNNNSGVCCCVNYKYEWYFKDNSLVVPEYVVDFEYTTSDPRPRSALYNTFHGLKTEHSIEVVKEIEKNLNDMYKKCHSGPLQSKLIVFVNSLSEQSLKLKITTLNLTNCQLKSVAEIESLENLSELIVSFNCLMNLKDISNKRLKVLDVSFNNLQTLDEMNDLLNLKILYVQHNFLTKTREEISSLHNHVPNLSELNVKYNHFQKSESVRLRIIGRLKYLKILNDKEVTENELKIALDLVFKSRITESDIVECGRTDTIRPRTLIMDDVASILSQCSENKLVNPVNDFSKFLRITSLNLNSQNISKISNIDALENLKYLSLSNNYISKIEGLEHCGHLEELILDNNTLTKIENLSRLLKLKKISLNVNYINSISHLRNVTSLQVVSLHSNRIVSLIGIEMCDGLTELYVANNFINDSSEITNLKVLTNLIILDLYNNPIVESGKNYRLNVVFHLKHLKALDGICIDNSEINQSKEVLGGRLNLDFIREKICSENLSDITELDLSNCFLKSVDLSPIEKLKNVKSLNLENNNLSSFSGLIQMNHLKVLCLNSNAIESIIPKSNSKIGILPIQRNEIDRKVHLNSLEVLHLGYNNIKSLGQLGLHYIPSLKALFLQGNDISVIEGMENLINLRELVLDQNRIKMISENSLGNNFNLREIHLEDNRLKNINHIYHIKNLKRLYLGNNKISELQDLDLFYCFECLLDISLFGNPVCRKHLHRQYLIHMIPSLLMIDGLEVTEEEKIRVESNLEENDSSNLLPGIVIQNKSQSNTIVKQAQNSMFYSQNDLQSTSKGDFLKKRPNPINPYNIINKNNGVQLVANTKAVYFYDPIGQNESVPRLYMNKKK